MHVTLTVHFALSTDLAAAAKLINSVGNDVDDILRTNLVHDVPVGTAHTLDAEHARTKMDELALGGNARVPGGIGVIFNVPDDLLAVRDVGEASEFWSTKLDIWQKSWPLATLQGYDGSGLSPGPAVSQSL